MTDDTAYSNILIALELYGDEQHIIEAGIGLAATDAAIRFIHVFVAPVYPADSLLGSIPLQVREAETTRAKTQFAELGRQYRLSNCTHTLVVGRAATEIHRVAEEMGADLIVVGSHGHHGIGLLLGSTANAVLHGASCDVLAVRLREDR